MDHQRNIETPAARKFVLSRGLPKTGQITSYNGGDDGEIEAGWWRGRLNADNKTRYRFTSIAGDGVVIDLATGLMWAADGSAAGCNNGNPETWINSIACATNLDFAGFDDWRLPNVKELISIVEYDAALFVVAAPLIAEPPFTSTVYAFYWSATTVPADTLSAMCCDFTQGKALVGAKTLDTIYMRCVRGGV